jgi:hypothetical protein
VNPIKGAGAVLLLALIAVLLSGVGNTSDLVVGISVTVVVSSLATFLASVRRRRRDRRTAGG